MHKNVATHFGNTFSYENFPGWPFLELQHSGDGSSQVMGYSQLSRDQSVLYSKERETNSTWEGGGNGKMAQRLTTHGVLPKDQT